MTGDAPAWLLAVLTAASGLVLAALAWDLHHRLPRAITAARLVKDAEQACIDDAFHRITRQLEQP